MVENMVDLVARVSARASDIQGAKQLSQVDKTWLERMTKQHSGSQVWADVDKRNYGALANRFLSGK